MISIYYNLTLFIMSPVDCDLCYKGDRFVYQPHGFFLYPKTYVFYCFYIIMLNIWYVNKYV